MPRPRAGAQRSETPKVSCLALPLASSVAISFKGSAGAEHDVQTQELLSLPPPHHGKPSAILTREPCLCGEGWGEVVPSPEQTGALSLGG